MDRKSRDRKLAWLKLLGVLVVSTVGVTPGAEATMVVYNYVGRAWVYSGAPGPTYGTHAIATLSVDDSALTPGRGTVARGGTQHRRACSSIHLTSGAT